MTFTNLNDKLKELQQLNKEVQEESKKLIKEAFANIPEQEHQTLIKFITSFNGNLEDLQTAFKVLGVE